MHLIIPMSGQGQRFINAGYADVKPLIRVDGKPIIEHVLNLFPGNHKISFICNNEHLATTPMQTLLQTIAPSAQIIAIDPHKKGPVYAVAQMFDQIDDAEEVIVNYCDFSMYWDYAAFLSQVRAQNADGAIPAYRGFHPHMLGSTNYAFIQNDGLWLQAIKEKEPFTKNRMNEYASTGTYYFKRGAYVKKYFQALMDANIHVNGEYYVSLVYNLLQRDNLATMVYEVEHMLQWGMPYDLEEYQTWSNYFRQCLEIQESIEPNKNSINLIPLAGRGSRFADDGYLDPKPLIPVNGKPMILQAAASLPPAEKNHFVCLKEHLQKYPHLATVLQTSYTNTTIAQCDSVTQGQACSCMAGLQGADPEAELLIAACDNGMLWNQERYRQLLDDPSVDAIVWSFRNHPSSKRNPTMYSWIKINDQDVVEEVSLKQPISSTPERDHAVVGTFYFKKTTYFFEAFDWIVKNNMRTNGEFYVDTCINALIAIGRRVKVFEVDHYVCWGTPNDLRTYEYWQSFFHKCTWHPYRLEHDPMALSSTVGKGSHERFLGDVIL